MNISTTAVGRRCIFCQVALKRSNRSREHIIPWGVQKALGFPRHPTETFRGSAARRERLATMDLGSFVAGQVCTECNTGWMRRLEEEFRPLLVMLANCERGIGSLTDAERSTLCRWVAKTVFCVLDVALVQAPVPRTQAEVLYLDQRLPDAAHVFGTQFSAGGLFGVHAGHHDVLTLADVTEIARFKAGSYLVILVLNKLALMMTYHSMERWVTVFDPNSWAMLTPNAESLREARFRDLPEEPIICEEMMAALSHQVGVLTDTVDPLAVNILRLGQ